jgi:hypothetical protein
VKITPQKLLKVIPKYARLYLFDLAEMIRYFLFYRGSRFNTRAFSLGFRDHGVLPKNEALLHRLLAAYRKAKEHEAKASGAYQLRGEWEHIVQVTYAPLVRALREQDAETLNGLLQNFCRNTCTRGLAMSSDFFDLRFRLFNRYTYLCLFNDTFESWRKLAAEDFDAARFGFPSIGNGIGLMVDGYLIPRASIRHRYYAKRMLDLLGDGRRAIAEIGGGYGGFGYYILKEPKGMRYLNFDLPEVLVIHSFLLLNAFPDKKIVLYGETPDLGEALRSADAVLYPHFAFSALPALSVDLVYNSRSMTEMDEATVREYYRDIGRVARRYFFHVNHDDEDVYDRARGKKHVKLSKFSLPDGGFRTVFSMRPSLHDKLYFEYLYERKTTPALSSRP